MIPVALGFNGMTAVGLVAGARRLLAGGVPALVLEAAPMAAGAVAVAPLAALRAPVLGVIGAVASAAEPGDHIGALDYDSRDRALAALRATAPAVAALRTRRLVVPVGAAGLAGEALALEALREPGAVRATVRGAWWTRTAADRARHVESLCRTLHGLTRACGGVNLLLMPTAHALGLMDTEVAGWILDDLAGTGIGLALDLGCVRQVAAAGGGDSWRTWVTAHAPRLGLVCVSGDDDAVSRAAGLPPVADDAASVKEMIARSVPKVLRPPVSASVDDAIALAADWAARLGSIGDVHAW